MRRRLVRSTAVIALASVLILGIPLGLVESARVHTEATTRLESEADAVASVIDDRLEAHQPISGAALGRYVKPGHRVVILRPRTRITVGSPLRGRSTRAHSGSIRGATVVAEAPAGEVNHRIARAWLLLAALAVGSVGAAVALALVQARRLARPLESLAETSSRLGQGDFSTRAGRFSIPEVDALAQVLDRTAERIARLVAREREFSANVSHQLRTPLTALRLRLEELGVNPPSRDDRAEVEAALGEMDRVEQTIAGLLAHARHEQSGEATELDLAELAARHATVWGVLFARAGRQLDLRAHQPGTVWASAGAVGQVLDVLLENALRHGRGRVELVAGGDERRGWLSVADEGSGVDPDEAERLFERGASDSGGTGIGLHLAQVLAGADGGELRLARGVPPLFELSLPRTGPPSARAHGAADSATGIAANTR